MVPDWVNLPLVFVIITAATGAVVLLDRFYLRPQREASNIAEVPAYVDFSRGFFPIFAVILVLRSFVFEPYRIPSESMVPTLLIGDFVVVNKYSYGLRLPVTNTLIWETGAPKRGDVAVFRKPDAPNVNFIKRVVGLPGDRIDYGSDHILRVNGEPVAIVRTGSFKNADNEGLLFDETLGEVVHPILIQATWTQPFTRIVGPDCYFMMGDNRDRSHDSRFPDIGCVPTENLVGRATRIWMSWQLWDMPRWGRIGNKIQ